MQADDPNRLERRYVTAPHLMLESHDAAHTVILDTATGARMRVSPAVYGILARFDVPRTITEVFGRSERDKATARVHALVERRLLVDPSRPLTKDRPMRKAVPYRFCHAPSGTTREADIVVIGVPYDLGGLSNGREGPQAIRQKSLDYVYLVDFESRRPSGWFDTSRGERILVGIRIADAEDVAVVHGEDQRATFERVTAVMDDVLGANGIPLVLAGDASVAHPVAAWLAGQRPISVVQFTAHEMAEAQTGTVITVRDCLRAMASLPGVHEVIRISPWPDDTGRRPFALEASLSDRLPSLPLLLSIDLNAVDVTIPPTGRGFSLREMRDAIRLLGQRCAIAGIVMAGLDPSTAAGNLAAIVAAQLALHAADVATIRGTEEVA